MYCVSPTPSGLVLVKAGHVDSLFMACVEILSSSPFIVQLPEMAGESKTSPGVQPGTRHRGGGGVSGSFVLLSRTQ